MDAFNSRHSGGEKQQNEDASNDFGGEHRYNVTGLFHDMWGFPSNNPKIVNELLRHLVDKIDNNVQAITRHKEHCMEGADYILVSYGSSARSAIQA